MALVQKSSAAADYLADSFDGEHTAFHIGVVAAVVVAAVHAAAAAAELLLAAVPSRV